MIKRPPSLGLGLVSVMLACFAAACTPVDPATPDVIATDGSGRCFGRDTTPAVIETVTEQIVVQPAVLDTDGTVRSPAVFRTVTRQAILRERREVEFETLCPEALTPEFVASLQRALQTRGYYRGQITGEMDMRTREAIRSYQRQKGSHDTSVLDIATARAFGLIALTSAELDAEG